MILDLTENTQDSLAAQVLLSNIGWPFELDGSCRTDPNRVRSVEYTINYKYMKFDVGSINASVGYKEQQTSIKDTERCLFRSY